VDAIRFLNDPVAIGNEHRLSVCRHNNRCARWPVVSIAWQIVLELRWLDPLWPRLIGVKLHGLDDARSFSKLHESADNSWAWPDVVNPTNKMMRNPTRLNRCIEPS
jgi:hypothetical protein